MSSTRRERTLRPHDRRALHEPTTGCPTPTSSRPRPGGDAFLVDAGGPVAPLLEKADEHGLNVTHVLLTHHHHDHVAELGEVLERWPDAAVLAHAEERVPGTTGELSPDDEVEIGGLTVQRAAHARPHRGDARRCSSTATCSPATRCSRARSAACARPAARATPTSSTRSWTCCSRCRRRRRSAPATPTRRRSPTSSSTTASCASGAASTPRAPSACTALGEPATLILLGDDYDGGHKAWVRWPDGATTSCPARRVEPLEQDGWPEERVRDLDPDAPDLGLAAVAAAMIVPMFWERGTLIATAMTPVIVALVVRGAAQAGRGRSAPCAPKRDAPHRDRRRRASPRAAADRAFEPLPAG